jgi:D-beta-D-heptose 7-phosphate kinase/D-beta-D-heptose 1-phosphate adenosyltransferase
MTDISAFKNTHVLVVGDVMLDRYCWGTVSRISPEAPVPIVLLDRETARPGGAANVAANVAALGGKASVIGVVGGDKDAEVLRSSIRDAGVDESGLTTSSSRRTIVKTRILAHGQQIVRLDSEESSAASLPEEGSLVDSINDRLSSVDVVIISDYGKGSLSFAGLTKIINACKKAGKPVLADPKGKYFDKYAGATILTPNRREAADACKLEESDPHLVSKAGRQLLLEHEFDSVLITESENGMTLFPQGEESVHFGTTAQEVFDVTGAGDTVIASLGIGLAARLPLVEAVRIANIAAGISVKHIGTAAVSFQELESALQLERVRSQVDGADDI